jgi:hypothetical protein
MSGTKFSKRQLVGFDFTKWNEYTEQSLASAPEAFVSLLNCAVQEAYTDMCVLRGVRNPVVPRFEHRAGTLVLHDSDLPDEGLVVENPIAKRISAKVVALHWTSRVWTTAAQYIRSAIKDETSDTLPMRRIVRVSIKIKQQEQVTRAAARQPESIRIPVSVRKRRIVRESFEYGPVTESGAPAGLLQNNSQPCRSAIFD